MSVFAKFYVNSMEKNTFSSFFPSGHIHSRSDLHSGEDFMTPAPFHVLDLVKALEREVGPNKEM